MTEIVLEIQDLTKQYGHIRAVDHLSLQVEQGTVYGILGPNGSGKTTTLGMLLDVIQPDAGTFRWFGQTSSKTTRQRLGAILEHPNFYPYLSASRNLQIIADIKNADPARIEEVLKMVDLWERKNDRFRTYSYGMKQRLAIASALLGQPEVLILDEPTNGLDPRGIAEIRQIISRIGATGTTIFLASHMLDEVQKTCSHVTVLEKGKKLFSGKVDDVLNDSVVVEIAASDMEQLQHAVTSFKQVLSVSQENDKLLVKLHDTVNGTELNQYLFAQGVTLSHLSTRKKTLENYFLELTSKNND